MRINEQKSFDEKVPTEDPQSGYKEYSPGESFGLQF